MSDSQGETSGTSRTDNTTTTTTKKKIGGPLPSESDISSPSTSSSSSSQHHSKMGVEHKLSSSSREMRNMAEKMRRDKLNNYVTEIAGIVPLGSGANKRIDKTSVLRLAANYIRMHKVLKEDDESSSKIPAILGREITHSLAEAVGGFLLVVTSSGKVVYITEAVDQFFGHTQVDLLGNSIYSVIHPDDHDIFQQQLLPKENPRRSFFCRMMEKALCRNDPGRYEIIHVVGQLRPLPQIQSSSSSCSVTSPSTPSPGAHSPFETNPSSDNEDNECSDSDGDLQPLKLTNKTGTHMLVSFVRVVKDRPITELSLVESTQDEYITRHGMDGKILYTDHRISFVTGLMPSEVVGTSAFNYMHEDDIVWSIVAQKLMFTSAQGQGIISYRLKCRDGKHVTLRTRGFLEVNKQTGQVESFVCINTVLSIKEAKSEIKNQRRKLLPVIACHDTEDHLGSITSSLPSELMMILKQMMNPQMMQKMIESVKNNESLEVETVELTKALPLESGSSLSPTQENTTDTMKNTDHCGISHPFQTKPKRHYSEVSFESVPESCVRSVSVEEDQWHRLGKKRSKKDCSEVVTKKISFEKDMSCPELLHPDFNMQFNPRTSPQPHLSPSTSSVPENIQNYPTGTCQQFSNFNDIESNTDGGTIHTKKSHHHQNTGAMSPVSYWQHKPLTSPMTPGHCDPSTMSFEKGSPSLPQNLPSPARYNQQLPVIIPTSPSYDQHKGDTLLSPGLGELDINDSVTPHGNYNQGISGSQLSSNLIQNKCEAGAPSPSNYKHDIGSYNQSTNQSISSSSSYRQNVCQGLSSVGDTAHSERKPTSIPQNSNQSVPRNVSPCNVPFQCNYQYNISPMNDQNQLFPQYQQVSTCMSLTTNEQHYSHSISHQPQSSLSHRTFSTNSGHYSDFPPHLQKQSNPHTRQLQPEPESSHLNVPIASSHNIPLGEVGTLGVSSVPEPTIPEQLSSCEDPLSKGKRL